MLATASLLSHQPRAKRKADKQMSKKTITANEIQTTGGYFYKKNQVIGWPFYNTPQEMNVQETLQYFEEKFKEQHLEIQSLKMKLKDLTKTLTTTKEKEIKHAKENFYVVEEIENKIINTFSCFSKAKEYMENCLKENKAIKMNKKMLKALQEECED